MNSEIINSFSLVGNIASINEIKEQTNGNKFRYFTLAQNNKFIDKDGNLKNVPSFINIKIYEKHFKEYENILKIGKYLNIFGKINVYKDEDNKNKMNLVATCLRELTKNKEEIFDYDWLNDNQESDEMER